MSAATTAPAVVVGSKVLVRFGRDSRTGVVEYIDGDGCTYVRISAGWLHKERVARLEVL